MRCTSNFRQGSTAQLFVAYGGQVTGKPICKQRFSKWLVECIKFTYDQNDLPTLDRVEGHQTHKMAVTYMYADMAGADSQTICETACWENTCMFAKFYWLDAIANSDAEFGRSKVSLKIECH